MRRATRLLPLALGALLAFPLAVRAATPISIELSADAESLFRDEELRLTATTNPFAENLTIHFELVEGTLAPARSAETNPNGVARVTFTGLDEGLYGAVKFKATFDGNETYDPATSNEIEVTFALRPATMTITFSNGFTDDGVVNIGDIGYVRPRLTADLCVGGFTIFENLEGGGFTPVGGGTATMDVGGEVGACGANISLGFLDLGTHSYRVTYDGGTLNEQLEEDPVVLEVTLIETQTSLIATPNPTEAGATTRLTATVSTEKGVGFVEGAGSFGFYDGVTLLGTVALTTPGSASGFIDVTFPSAGMPTLHATWSGSTIAATSTSPTLSLTVGPNLVHAIGVGVSATTFYPIVDGYRDTVFVKGTLQETASVAISIKNLSSGSVVRTLSVPEQGAGGYSVAWNGRNASGNLVAAGSYRVRQVITDELGATLTVDSTVTVSKKKLVWHSAAKTKLGNEPDATGKTSGVTFTSSPLYAGGIRIHFPLGTAGRFGALGYEFRMASGVAYKAIKFSVQGSGTKSPRMGLHDKTLGTWPSDGAWVIDYFAPFQAVPKAFGWTELAGDANANRSGRLVRGLLLAFDWSSGSYDVAKVKLTYKYATLE